jgi:phospholipase C
MRGMRCSWILAFAFTTAACDGTTQLLRNDAGVKDGHGGSTAVTGADGRATIPPSEHATAMGTTTVIITEPSGGIPIKHVVIIVKENHTFDNYFGSFPGAAGTSTCAYSNGTTFPCGHAPDATPRDLDHGHDAALTDWNHGLMNGFDLTSGTSVNGDNLGYAQYHESDIPNYWQYARHFVLGDHFFAEMMGPSFPGHLVTVAGQSAWAIDNPNTTGPFWGCDQIASARISVQDQQTCMPTQVFPCFDIPSIPDILPMGIDWKFYGTNFYVLPEVWTLFDAVKKIRKGPDWAKIVTADHFESDIDAGKLPAVSWLVDQDLADEHPRVGSVCAGENWTVQKINKLMQSQYWNESAIVFTMDDFGGWYDHVPPPIKYGCDSEHPYGLGFRLPLIVISPYAKAGFVFSEIAEQASIARFVERIFGSTMTLHDLDPNARDADSNDLMNAFDFTQTPLPPLVLPTRPCL